LRYRRNKSPNKEIDIMARSRKRHRLTCRKRRGSPRFSATCKAKFRECMRGELKATGSLKSAGRTCMRVLHQCETGRGHTRAMHSRRRRRR
jgi:hypothetical protein